MGLTSKTNFLPLLLWITFTNGCPPSEDIAPFCTCNSMHGDVFFTCRKILSPEQLTGPIREIAEHGINVYSLAIDESNLKYIPDGLFKNTVIEKISFFGTEIKSLSDTDVAFSGLEESLTEIRATDAPYVAQWDFTQIRNLHRLKVININAIFLEAVSHPFPKLPELTALGIVRAKISNIVDSAFSNLPQLTIFNMMGNNIEIIKRNMFPDPAEKLNIIDLSVNDISHLPADFFSNMPSLKEVHLDYNQFKTLTEEPFSEGFSILRELTMTDNPFRCDCSMKWLTNVRFPYRFVAHCEKPDHLYKTPIRKLDAKSIECL